jgi:diacylglycerol kinase (ATP)
MRSFFRGFVYAFEGVAYVVRTQRNARVHLLAAGLVILAGACFRIAAIEWGILALTVGAVFGAEMINTALELQVDLASSAPKNAGSSTPRGAGPAAFDPKAKAAKDAGAGAVLITALAAVAVGVSIFGPRLWALIAR